MVLGLAVLGSAGAAQRRVEPDTPLQPLIEAAAPGEVLLLAPGRHAGPLVIDRPLALRGEPGAIVEGPGTGSVITVAAPDVRIEGLEVPVFSALTLEDLNG